MFRFCFQVIACCLFFALVRVAESKDEERSTVQNTETDNKGGDITQNKGHLRPFGESGPRLQVEERNDFPEPVDFLRNYVKRSRPVKLSGVARNSRAVRLWLDDYFLGLDVPVSSGVEVEVKKKEMRHRAKTFMHFHQFLRIYNQSEYYMVDHVPSYLRPDVMMPCSLQCEELKKALARTYMWFSSGGTKSVIHIDALDNMNCLIRGQKTFVFVDPKRHQDKIRIRSDGFYSDIDVDSVDLTQHPGVAQMEFYHVNITAGDCLFIPYRWIHQVRSYNSNLAVNLWFDHYAAISILQSSGEVCRAPCDPSLSLDQLHFPGIDVALQSYQNIRDWMGIIAMNNPFGATIEDVLAFAEEYSGIEVNFVMKAFVSHFFDLVDMNKNGLISPKEHADIPVKIWKETQEELSKLVEKGRRFQRKKETASREEL